MSVAIAYLSRGKLSVRNVRDKTRSFEARVVVIALIMTVAGVAACGCGGSSSDGANQVPPTKPQDGPPAGYPNGHALVPAEGQGEDVSSPTTVIGTGSPASCTGDVFVNAVANGGIITFNCGPDPVTIVLTKTAKVRNDKGTKLVIDGGNKVTLSGGGTTRILYMATCDKAQVYPPGRRGWCDSQA